MDIESLDKYLNKKIILILKNGFNYRGKITKIYNSSFDFIDVIENELTVDISNVSLMQIDKTENLLDGEKKEGRKSYDYSTKKNPTEPATEKQIGFLKKLKYNGNTKDLTKIEAKKLIEEGLHKDKKEENYPDY